MNSVNTLTEEKAVTRIIPLWQKVFGDEEEYIRSFYRSFDTAGNIFYAVQCRDKIQVISDLSMNDGEVIGLVNRVPLKLRVNNKIYEGYYIYAGCVDPSYRGYGIYRDLMREAERDTLFTVLIPADGPLFGMYRRLGYTETAGTPFPYETDRLQIRGLETEPYDGDTELLYRLYLAAEGDRFIKDKPFFLLTVSDFASQGYIFYLKDANGLRCGYIIYSENKNTIKVYDICCQHHKYFDIIESNMSAAENIRYKSMVRGIAGAPALNMFGEY